MTEVLVFSMYFLKFLIEQVDVVGIAYAYKPIKVQVKRILNNR